MGNVRDKIRRFTTRERLRLVLTPEFDTAIILDDEENKYYIAKYSISGTVFSRIVTEEDLAGIGGGGGSGLQFTRNVAAEQIVTINHSLNKHPNVIITDASGNEVMADIQHITANTVVVIFNKPFTGEVKYG